jgi:hypothetical protein
MPMIRKLITVGNSRAITIPDDWLKYHEERMGKQLETLLMEINNKITLKVDTGLPSSKDLESWRQAVITRDKRTCQECGYVSRQHRLVAHHILPRNLRPDLALDINNGKTYCKSCHVKIHYRGPNSGNTRESSLT